MAIENSREKCLLIRRYSTAMPSEKRGPLTDRSSKRAVAHRTKKRGSTQKRGVGGKR